MKNDPSDRLKRFKILQVKAERLYREAVAQSKWDTYSEVLALIDHIEALFPLEFPSGSQQIKVNLASDDGEITPESMSKQNSMASIVIHFAGVYPFAFMNFRFNILNHLGNHHPDAGVRETNTRLAIAAAKQNADWLIDQGIEYEKQCRDQMTLSCNQIGWYACEHVSNVNELREALGYVDRGYRYVDEPGADKSYIRDTKVRLMLKLGQAEAAYRIVFETLRKHPSYSDFQDFMRNSEYRLWMREDEMSKQTHLRGLPKIKITDNGQTKTSHMIREMRGKFKVSKMPYISKEIDKWFPPPATRTERVFLMSVEPDEGTFHKAASEVDPGRQGITVRERLLYELVYFDKAGGHLDLQGQTICSGSQGVRVGSPRVFFDDEVGRGELSIHLEGIDTPYELGGFRMPVSFQE